MSDYILFLYDDPSGLASISPEEMQQIIERYHAWGENLKAEGRLIGSEKLQDGDGRVLRSGEDGVRVTDGPFSEAKEVIGGYFAIRAESYDEAVEISRTCPHLELGGTIAIRAIEALDLDE